MVKRVFGGWQHAEPWGLTLGQRSGAEGRCVFETEADCADRMRTGVVDGFGVDPDTKVNR